MATHHSESKTGRDGFCIYIDTICQGPVPVWRDGEGKYLVFKTEIEAQREIADDLIMRLEQFMDGERDFDDAMTVEEYIVPVTVQTDGSFTDEDGNCFGPCSFSAPPDGRNRLRG
jgi:hypothetical protein